MRIINISTVKSKEDYQCAIQSRREIYQRDGKYSKNSDYTSKIDDLSTIYLIKVNGQVVGTFSIFHETNKSSNPEVFKLIKEHLNQADKESSDSMYVHSLGIKKEFRSSIVLKKVFSEIFKTLVISNKKYIIIAADQRLKSKYKWIGFKSTDIQVHGQYLSSGPLDVMYTRQERFGIYGLHADPIRWNIFLREAISELKTRKIINHSLIIKALFLFYSLFDTPAKAVEKLSNRFLKTNLKNNFISLLGIRNV